VDVSKVPPRTAVEQLAGILDSPEIAALIKTLEYVRWTGRKGYPLRSMVAVMLAKTLYALPTWTRTLRLIAEHSELQAVIGCLPSQWACYRFANQMRDRDSWALQICIDRVVAGLKVEHPEMGTTVAIDASDLPAYANGSKDIATPSDPDASWGHRSAVSTRGKGGFYGYKLHAAVDVHTGLPVAWTVATARDHESPYAVPLVDRLQKRGFDVKTAIMDKGYDNSAVYGFLALRQVATVIPLKETGPVKRGAAEPPHCCHGEWTYAGTDYKRAATKWRCPTGECKPGSMWLKMSRLHPLIPRNTQRFDDLYRKRGAVEREFGRLKHEWSLLPLRVRGIERVRLHADLTILGRLCCRLVADRSAVPIAA
jgi:hypothetical protein